MDRKERNFLINLPTPEALFENSLLTYEQAAQYLSLSKPYLRKLKAQGKVPWVQIGVRGVRFRLRSLNQWVEKREIK